MNSKGSPIGKHPSPFITPKKKINIQGLINETELDQFEINPMAIDNNNLQLDINGQS